mgnify:CR=1 FL=1
MEYNYEEGVLKAEDLLFIHVGKDKVAVKDKTQLIETIDTSWLVSDITTNEDILLMEKIVSIASRMSCDIDREAISKFIERGYK